MEQRLSLVTLGVRKLDRAAAFYDALGWQRASDEAGIVAYDLIGMTLALFPVKGLAHEMDVPKEAIGTGGITLGHNVPSPEDVAAVLKTAEAAGARILRAPEETPWGGFNGYFADPEGHVWEVAYNPHAPLGPDGRFQWNGAG